MPPRLQTAQYLLLRSTTRTVWLPCLMALLLWLTLAITASGLCQTAALCRHLRGRGAPVRVLALTPTAQDLSQALIFLEELQSQQTGT